MANHLNGRPLQHFYSIDIVNEGDCRVVYFNSTIHVNRRVKMPVTYSLDFTDRKILNDADLIRGVRDRYGDVYKNI